VASAMVGIDARWSDVPPRVGFTLTTKAATTPPKVFADDVRQAFRFLAHPRRLGTEVERLGFVEHQTGLGQRSGGHRRIHLHGLIKGADGLDRLQEIEAELSSFMRHRNGAHRVELRELRSVAGATAYLTLHHHKKGQRPPPGWTGRRLRPSRGYYALPAAELREDATKLVRDRRRAAALRAAINFAAYEEAGCEDIADDLLATALEEAESQPPAQLVRVAPLPAGWTEDGLPTGYTLTVLGLEG
jgi:hypothetical protein